MVIWAASCIIVLGISSLKTGSSVNSQPGRLPGPPINHLSGLSIKDSVGIQLDKLSRNSLVEVEGRVRFEFGPVVVSAMCSVHAYQVSYHTGGKIICIRLLGVLFFTYNAYLMEEEELIMLLNCRGL